MFGPPPVETDAPVSLMIAVPPLPPTVVLPPATSDRGPAAVKVVSPVTPEEPPPPPMDCASHADRAAPTVVTVLRVPDVEWVSVPDDRTGGPEHLRDADGADRQRVRHDQRAIAAAAAYGLRQKCRRTDRRIVAIDPPDTFTITLPLAPCVPFMLPPS